jgi:hypothetical protein
MSTPGFVGVLHTDRTVELIYIHFDCYPIGIGPGLLTQFNSLEKAEEIVANGWRDCLIPGKGSKVRFYDDQKLTFENWDKLEKYLKNRLDIFYIYVWNEPVQQWEFVKNSPDSKHSVYGLTNLQKFLNFNPST